MQVLAIFVKSKIVWLAQASINAVLVFLESVSPIIPASALLKHHSIVIL
jgi:hypothetical protein